MTYALYSYGHMYFNACPFRTYCQSVHFAANSMFLTHFLLSTYHFYTRYYILLYCLGNQGSYALSASHDRTLELHFVGGEQPGRIRVFRGHKESVSALGISHDNRLIFSGTMEGNFKIWNTLAEAKWRWTADCVNWTVIRSVTKPLASTPVLCAWLSHQLQKIVASSALRSGGVSMIGSVRVLSTT